MITFVLWWLIGSVVGAGIGYVLMRDSDNDDD